MRPLWIVRLIVYPALSGLAALLLTYIVHSCDGSEGWQVRWWSFDGKTARFRYDGDKLVVREKVTRRYDDGTVGERNYSLEARLANGRVTGTMRVVEDLGSYVCESGDVSFSAG